MVGKGLTRVTGLILPNDVALRRRPYTAEGLGLSFQGLRSGFRVRGVRFQKVRFSVARGMVDVRRVHT